MSGVPENFNRRWPSSFTSVTVAKILVGCPPASCKNDLRSDARVLPGRSMAHQSFGAFSSSSRISNLPPVLAFEPRNRAGITRELFSTSTSPARKNSSKSGNCRCSMRSVRRDAKPAAAIDRAAARAVARSVPAAGQNRKSAVRIARVLSFRPEVSSCHTEKFSGDFRRVFKL